MDWDLAIKRNREALLGIVAGLMAMVGGLAVDPRAKRGDEELPKNAVSLPRRLRLTILRILRPAEAALRRLIVIVAATRASSASTADGLAGAKSPSSLPDFSGFGHGKTFPAFRLFDPTRRFAAPGQRMVRQLGVPRITIPGFAERAPAPTRDDEAAATRILRRIAALDQALKTLPRQARRLIRLTALRARKPSGNANPLRRGPPPGWCRHSRHDVHAVLRECHGLAHHCGLKPP